MAHSLAGETVPPISRRRGGWLAQLLRQLSALDLQDDLLRIRRTVGHLLGQRTANPTEEEPGATIQAMLEGPESRIRIGRGALLIAREEDPHLDLKLWQDELEVMAIRLRKRIWGIRDPERVVELCNQFIFEEEGFGYAEEPPEEGRQSLDNLLLPSVLQRRRGYCVGLSLLYLTLAERLGLPLYGVALPRHFLVRYDDGRTRLNIEVTRQGACLPDSYYQERYGVTDEHVERGVWLVNLTRREVLIALLNNLGNFHYTSGNVRQALESLRRVTTTKEDLATGQLGMGFLHQKRGDLKKAIGCYQRAVAVDPELTAGHLNLGVIFLQLGMLPEAETALQQALERDPNNSLALTNLGHLAALRDDPGKAIMLHEQALAAGGEAARVLNNLGIAYHRHGRYRWAIRAFHRAIRREPELLAAQENLAKVFLKSGRRWRGRRAVRKVIRAYRRAFASRPQDDQLYFGLARFLLTVGWDRKMARSLVDKALGLRPDFPGYLELKAELHYFDKSYPRAIALVERILDRPPGELPLPAPHYHSLLDKYRRAWEILRR